MELSDLVEYARAQEELDVLVQKGWGDYPDEYTVSEHHSGTVIAYIMDLWDEKSFEDVPCCDIKCGYEFGVLVSGQVSKPFRKKGKDWAGVRFDKVRDEDSVYMLLDHAQKIARENAPQELVRKYRGMARKLYDKMRVNEEQPLASQTAYPVAPHSTSPVTFPETSPSTLRKASPASRQTVEASAAQVSDPLLFVPPTMLPPHQQDAASQPAVHDHTAATEAFNAEMRKRAEQAQRMAETLSLGLPRNSAKIPEKILQMQSLYTHEHRNGDINDAHNFVVQGTFMQDYEDDKPWLTNLIKFSPTYHDFNASQLRGYFTWRKYVRQGSLKQASPAFFTMYVYELLNGIGTRDVQDSLDKLLDFTQAMRKQHLGPLGAISMYQRWMLFLGIIYSFPPQTMRKYVDPELLEQDNNLVILRDFDEHNDAEVCQALDYFSGGKVSASPAVAKNPEVARHLFAQAWREINTDSPFEGEPLFVRCFDNPQTYPSEGLSDAVVLIDRPEQAVTYHLTDVTTIEYIHQKWMMTRYDKVFFQTELIGRLVHSVDLVLRKLLKTGHYLRHKAQDQVFDQVAHTVVQQYQARQSEEKAKAQVAAISIDFSQLKAIRRDADVTRENLLTDEERGVDNALSEKIESEVAQNEPETKNAQKPELPQQQTSAQKPVIPTKTEDVPDQIGKAETSVLAQYHDVLTKLLAGSDVSQDLRDKHLMASMVADAINDALYEQIGDVVIESDGDNLSLVPDYEEDVRAVLGEEHQDE